MATSNLEIRKKALIIGNNDYQVDPLRSCVNDAQDITEKLRGFDFDVTLGQNRTYLQMSMMIDAFTESITGQDLVVFFFSGHGNQLNERNYLIAIDNQWIVEQPSLSKKYATCAQTTLDDMVAKKPFAVVFLLDCCRETIKTSSGTKATSQRENQMDFAPMQSHAGSLIVYACGPNQKALDHSPNRRNSLFTYHLLEHIVEPNLKVEEMMALVGGGVHQDSKGKLQVHRSSNLLTPHIYFNCNKKNEISTEKPSKPKTITRPRSPPPSPQPPKPMIRQRSPPPPPQPPKPKYEEFAKPGTYKELYCEGRACAKCHKCRDWTFTGDKKTWNWLANYKNFKTNDWDRYREDKIWNLFTKRDGATCGYPYPLCFCDDHFVGS